jgi:molybdopterin/thiamine biosynthesis adenylyltransferase
MTRGGVNTVVKSKRAIFRITGTCRAELERHLYKRYPDREWGTFFRFGFRRCGWGIALSFVDGLWPRPGDLRRDSPIVTINSEYSLRAVDSVTDSPFGIGMIHSHPEGAGTLPSSLDDDMDGYYPRLFQDYTPARPYCSLIFSRSDNGDFRFTGRVFVDGQWLPVDELLTVGDVLQRERAQGGSLVSNQSHSNGTPAHLPVESAAARLETLFGQNSAQRLRNATIAVVGCSGTGSPAIEAIARAGVRHLVVVDPQHFAASNLERLHGSIFADAVAENPLYKVEIMTRMIHEINPETEVTPIVGNILDEVVLDELLRADLILGCTDTQHSRAALGDFAAHYLLPSIDVGVVFEGAQGVVSGQIGQFTQLRPDQPCGFCDGMINPDALAAELMTDEEKESRRQAAREADVLGIDGTQYWRGDTPPLVTVGYLTSAMGSLAAGYAIGWITGKFSMPHARFQFDIGAPGFGFVDVERHRIPTCSCGRTTGHADQGRAHRSVAKPRHWPKAFLYQSGKAGQPTVAANEFYPLGKEFFRGVWARIKNALRGIAWGRKGDPAICK